MVFENHETFFDVWHRILFVSFHACIMLFLFDDAVVILLAGLYGMRMCRSITQCQGSYSHQTFWKIPILHQLLAFLWCEHTVFTVDPAGRKTDGVGCKHHIAQDEAAVLYSVHITFWSQDDDDGWRSVVRITLYTHDVCVHLAKLCANLRILNCYDEWLLCAMTGSCPSASFQNPRR